ncbi:hypothetical protein KEM52_000807 [Ascosphaera acerosa]|nr:hypothetical protein KEM52_000807 [Ascosphaera acerosa]
MSRRIIPAGCRSPQLDKSRSRSASRSRGRSPGLRGANTTLTPTSPVAAFAYVPGSPRLARPKTATSSESRSRQRVGEPYSAAPSPRLLSAGFGARGQAAAWAGSCEEVSDVAGLGRSPNEVRGLLPAADAAKAARPQTAVVRRVRTGSLSREQRHTCSVVADQVGGALAEHGSLLTSALLSPTSNEERPSEHRYAIGMGVNGVLLRGSRVLDEARQALRMLNGDNSCAVRIPFFLITNDAERSVESGCETLSSLLGTPILPSQYICTHSPLKNLARQHRTVLVVGREPSACRRLAQSYGFHDVVTTHDLVKSDPAMSPFSALSPHDLAAAHKRDLDGITIDAIIVISGSNDWETDAQVILDLCMARQGCFGTRSTTFGEGPRLYFAHRDQAYIADHQYPRLGLGAFKQYLQTTFTCLTRRHLDITVLGKPEPAIFQLADGMLADHRQRHHGLTTAPQTVYFVGHSPESDVRGTNEYDASATSQSVWRSVLVGTGSYEPGTLPEVRPYRVERTVADAVQAIIGLEQAKLQASWGRRLLNNITRRPKTASGDR